MHARDAASVAKILEYRCMCHERMGGDVVLIHAHWYPDPALLRLHAGQAVGLRLI